MKLLILTQKVDQNDDVLGFFHGWIQEFAKHCEQVTVVALGVGEYDLPKNVHVFSLGKELRKRSDLKNLSPRSVLGEQFRKIKYIARFYRLIWRERANYDVVFVHMNQEYVLLGGLLWRLLGKKMSLWRNHSAGNFLTRIAMIFSDKIFCTSKYSFTAQSNKATLMPAGINTELFKRDQAIVCVPRSILFLGRISPIKNVEVLIDAVIQMDKEGHDFVLDIVGSFSLKNPEYSIMVKNRAQSLVDKGKINFLGSVPNYKTPEIYNKHELFINLTDSGSFDKTIPEAMACECIPVVSNRSFVGMIPEHFLFKEKNSVELSHKIIAVLSASEEEKAKIKTEMKRKVGEEHSLTLLVRKILEIVG